MSNGNFASRRVRFADICHAGLLWLATLGIAAAADGLSVKVVTTNESSLYANCTIVMGERDMVLIDAPFTNADAHRLVADLLETGKNLTYVYVTHDHPDHFWSMQVIMDAFPQAKVISHREVVADIWRSIPFKIARWSPMLGNNGPTYPTAPLPLAEDTFELEGHVLRVLGPMQGDHYHATAVHVPDIGLLVAGDIVFHGIHVWLGETTAQKRQQWIANLNDLMKLEPATVVAGHKLPGLADDVASLKFTRDYIVSFEQDAKAASDSSDLMARTRARHPQVKDALGDFILTNSARVVMGEDPPWEE
ncbi:MAG: MBL fold metallo-hydrolase [Gammaproteobacteria bacterium]|nr:MBL fold metallo-hydrolase [Gammaproteobacteria bacterium]